MFENFGSDLLKGNGTDYATATTWTSVGCVQRINPPSLTVTDVEVPLCLNASSRVQDFLPGKVVPGECTYTILFAAGSISEAITALGTKACWRIKLGSSNKYVAFNGYFRSVGIPELTADGFVAVECGIKCSGAPAEITS